MTSGLFRPETGNTESPTLSLEITDQETKSPRLITVLFRNLSTAGVALTVTNPWDLPDLERYRGEACVLRVEDPGGSEPVNIRAQITWTRFGGTGQPPLSLGLQLIQPPGEAIRRLSGLLPHASQDIKELWARYDQVRENPGTSDLVHHCYITGLVLLLGGLVLQFAGSPGYQACGWALWLLGSLGIAGKIIRPFWPNRHFSEQIGRSL